LRRATTPSVLPSGPVGVVAVTSLPSSPAFSFSGSRTASIDSTTPTRVPPIRTSLLGTSRAAFGTTTETR
jgi:hypothetical protein